MKWDVFCKEVLTGILGGDAEINKCFALCLVGTIFPPKFKWTFFPEPNSDIVKLETWRKFVQWFKPLVKLDIYANNFEKSPYHITNIANIVGLKYNKKSHFFSCVYIIFKVFCRFCRCFWSNKAIKTRERWNLSVSVQFAAKDVCIVCYYVAWKCTALAYF